MGSPENEPGRGGDEEPRRCRPRPFAIATKEVTWQQFRRFRPDHPHKLSQHGVPFQCAGDGPVDSVRFYAAARYCNWLSSQEGIPPDQWCYIPSGGKADDEIKPHTDYLARTGFRLPTEEEWEYACRSGAETSRFFGQSESLLVHYAWYYPNAHDRPWPVG